LDVLCAVFQTITSCGTGIAETCADSRWYKAYS
jgi:hypothetical protein